jgi:hypothetical protein
MKIIENLIPKSLQDDIEQLVNNEEFAWYSTDRIYKDLPERIIHNYPTWNNKCVIPAPGLSHVTYYDGKINSPYFMIMRSVLYFLEHSENFSIEEILRIRIRRTFQFPNHNESTYTIPHIDYWDVDKFKTLIYYVEDSDGDTIIFDKKYIPESNASVDQKLNILNRIFPKKGKAVFFDGKQFHAGNCPINFVKRTVINFDFITKTP